MVNRSGKKWLPHESQENDPDPYLMGTLEERNARIFNNRAVAPLDLLATIKEEGRTWFLAGAKCLEFFFISE